MAETVLFSFDHLNSQDPDDMSTWTPGDIIEYGPLTWVVFFDGRRELLWCQCG